MDNAQSEVHYEPAQQRLFRHVKCEDWGLAILAWDHGTKRGYQFEDGKLRVFKEGFYHLLEPVDAEADRTELILARLSRSLGRQQAASRVREDRQLITFDQQLAVFAKFYPEGLVSEAWIAKMRGSSDKKGLKRHREPAIRSAKERFAPERFEKALGAELFDGVHGAAIEMLEVSTLVRPNQLSALRDLPQSRHEIFSRSLAALLHGEGPYPRRFEDFIRTMGDPGWSLATAFPALVHPTEHVCVNPAPFKEQALWMAPHMKHPKSPEAGAYGRYLNMARGVFAKLEEAGQAPRDLLDVHDFIYETLRPAARKLAKTAPKPTKDEAA